MLEILAAVRSLGLSLSGIALLALCGGGCTRNPPSSGDAPATARLTEPPPSASALRPQPVPETPADWVEAARMERWDEVARRIDALDPDDRQKPGTRYVRARAAAELGQHAESVKLLAGLEKELPLLAADIERYRAEAELEAGPFEQAARYFAQGRAPSSLVKAALAFERAGQLEQARAASDRALGALAKLASKNQSSDPAPEARARAVRARVSEKQGQIALAASDLRWITTFAPTLPEADGLDEHLERLSPPHALSKRERFQRAIDMAEHGFVEQTERELELIAKAKGQEPKPAELLRTRGWALFKARRDYARAAELLEQAAKLGSSDVARDLFYAARARSRAQEDERAIGMYEALVRRFPNTSWAEHASFLAARLRYLLGRWDEATPAYQRFLARHGKGQYGGTARYEQAVSWLAAKNYDKAMKAFSELAREENDEREQARALELEGVALAGAGKKDAAIARFRRVIREQPLSFPALASATRLAELGEPAGPPIEPGKLQTSAPLEPALPARAAQLVSLGLDRDAEQELVYSSEALRKRYAPRGDEALCRAHGQLATAAERYRIGQQAARFLDLRSAPTPSTRWLWDCIYPRPYESVVRQTETEWNLPTDFVYAVMRQESAFKSNAVSPAAAIGLMQLLEPTGKQVASELGVTATNGFLSSPPQNIRFGAYYLKKLLDAFGGQLPLAAAAYNAGPLAVNRWLETGETLPLDLWVARIPYEETRTYVARVLGNYARYAYLAGGEAALPKLALELPKGLRAPPNAY